MSDTNEAEQWAGLNMTPGRKDEQPAFRSEIGGIYAMAVLFKLITSFSTYISTTSLIDTKLPQQQQKSWIWGRAKDDRDTDAIYFWKNEEAAGTLVASTDLCRYGYKVKNFLRMLQETCKTSSMNRKQQRHGIR
jgi:hypothetical protein